MAKCIRSFIADFFLRIENSEVAFPKAGIATVNSVPTCTIIDVVLSCLGWLTQRTRRLFDPFEEPHEFNAAGLDHFDPFPRVWSSSSLARFGPDVCEHVVHGAEGLSDVERRRDRRSFHYSKQNP